MKHSYTIDEFKNAVKNTVSIRQALIKLGVEPKGGNYRVFKRFAKEHNIDYSHFLGKSSHKGMILGPKKPVEDYLIESDESIISSSRLRQRLIKEGYFEPKCSSCGLDTWLKKPIPLELEHKDGNHYNNRLENLCLLCPNCHALTPTYRGKNKKKS